MSLNLTNVPSIMKWRPNIVSRASSLSFFYEYKRVHERNYLSTMYNILCTFGFRRELMWPPLSFAIDNSVASK